MTSPISIFKKIIQNKTLQKWKANNLTSLGTRNARNDMIALGSPNVALWVLGKGYLVPATSSPLAFGESDVQLQGNQGAKALRPRPSWTVANMNPWYPKTRKGFLRCRWLCFAFQNKDIQPHGKRLKTITIPSVQNYRKKTRAEIHRSHFQANHAMP